MSAVFDSEITLQFLENDILEFCFCLFLKIFL